MKKRIVKNIVAFSEEDFLNKIEGITNKGYTFDKTPSVDWEYPSNACVLYRGADPNKKRLVYRATISKPRTKTIKEQLLEDPRNTYKKLYGKTYKVNISPEYLEELLGLDYTIYFTGELKNPTLKGVPISKSLFRTTLGMVDSLYFNCKTSQFGFNYGDVVRHGYYNKNTNVIGKAIRKALRNKRNTIDTEK